MIFWLYLFTYKPKSRNWSTVFSFLVFLNAEPTGSIFHKISITLCNGAFMPYATRTLFHIFWYPFKDDGPLTSLSTITCKLVSDVWILLDSPLNEHLNIFFLFRKHRENWCEWLVDFHTHGNALASMESLLEKLFYNL